MPLCQTYRRAWVAALLFLTSCAHVYTAHGVYYRVQKKDTLASIARKYQVDVQELAEVNNIQSSEELKTGRSIYIRGITPGILGGIIEREGKPRRRTGWKPKTRKGAEASMPSGGIEVRHDRFIWPVEGEISSLFGMRHGRRHDGVDIRAKRGTPVIAADEGEVVYSKRMRGYGNLVLLKHSEDLFTVYAHNSVNLVKKGQKVRKGETISKVGQTGRATGPHLHFEVREGTQPRNPLFFLPKTDYAQRAQKGDENHGGSKE